MNFAVIHSVLEEGLLQQDANYEGCSTCPAPGWKLGAPQKCRRGVSPQVEFGCVKGMMQSLQ